MDFYKNDTYLTLISSERVNIDSSMKCVENAFNLKLDDCRC